MSDFEQKRLRAEQLRKELNHHIYRYYVENENDIEDYEYDMLMRELDSIEKEYPELINNELIENRIYNILVNEFKPGISYTSEHIKFLIDAIEVFIPGLKISEKEIREKLVNIYNQSFH